MNNDPSLDHIPTADIQSDNVNPAAPASKPSGGMKVIQPLDPNLRPENTVPQPNTPIVTQAPIPSQAPSIPPQVPPTPIPSSDNAELVPENNKTKLIIIAVMVFGAFMIVLSATSLISWIRLSKIPGINSSTTILGLGLAGAELLLGIGIIMRREIARAIYVVLALILLVFSLYGTYNYFNGVNRLNQSEQESVTRTQQRIVQYQNNTYLSSSQKAQIIKTLEDTEKRQKQQLSKNKSTLVPLIEGYAISILPLVFLTRPAVKEVFD